MPKESPTPRKIKVAVVADDILDDDDVRRRVSRGELVPMRSTPLTPVDPLAMKRLRELAGRPLHKRGSGEE